MRNPMIYGKAKGIVLVDKYLPKLCPFKSIDIVGSIEEWNKVKDKYGDFVSNRVDYPIGLPRKNAIKGTSGYTREIPNVIEAIKKQDPNGVLLLLPKKEEVIIPPRYKDDGGFNISFNLGIGIIIELVGKGFDGHEVTQGIANHERYKIPWEEILFVKNRKDIMKNPNVEKSFVNQEMYEKQRQDRIEFLYKEMKGNDLEVLEQSIPKTYKLLPESVIEKLLKDIVFELFKKKTMLLQDNLTHFSVQGNIIEGNLQVWEIFRAERFVAKDIEVGR